MTRIEDEPKSMEASVREIGEASKPLTRQESEAVVRRKEGKLACDDVGLVATRHSRIRKQSVSANS